METVRYPSADAIFADESLIVIVITTIANETTMNRNKDVNATIIENSLG